MKKNTPWLNLSEPQLIPQLNQFTLKLAGSGYPDKYGLLPAQVTNARNDYLWLAYSITCTAQFQQEARNRSHWKNKLKNGPGSLTASDVPSIGSEFAPPAVPVVLDGIIPRFRTLVGYIKNHPKYTVADGIDLHIEATDQPSQLMKPEAALRATGPTTITISVKKDGHKAVAVWCRRGTEPAFIKLGVYTRARFEDSRPNLVPGQPECREYQFQYVDDDQCVGELSDVYRVITSGILAA